MSKPSNVYVCARKTDEGGYNAMSARYRVRSYRLQSGPTVKRTDH